MFHAPSLAARLQGWEGQSFNGGVAFLLEVVFNRHLHLLSCGWPFQEIELSLNFPHIFDIRAGPVTHQVVKESIL